MSSSEEYLDNLLKSLMEGSNDEKKGDASEESGMESLSPVSDQSGMVKEPVIGETNIPEGVAIDEASIPEEFAIDEGSMPEELVLDEGSIPEEFAIDEGSMPEELALDEGSMPEEFALDEISMPEETVTKTDRVGTDTNKAMTTEEIEAMLASMGSLSSEETTKEDEPVITAIEEPMGDEALEMPMLGESDGQENGLEHIDLSDLGLDDMEFGESEPAEDEPDDFLRDDALENLLASGNDQSDLLSLDDILMNDLPTEEPYKDMEESDMSEDDIDRILRGDSILGNDGNDDIGSNELSLDDLSMPDDLALTDDLAITDDFALEENGDQDDDLSALLAGMEHDEDLSEINDLLEKSDQGVSVDDDDMLAMLESVPDGEGDDNGSDAFDIFLGEGMSEAENIRELTPEELQEREENKKAKKEKKKKEKKEKKGRRKKGAAEVSNVGEAGEADMLESLLEGTADAEEAPKKQGFFARLMEFLLEEDEEEALTNNADNDSDMDELQLGNLSDENKQLLEELSEEDKKNTKKKGKKDKKKKEKKGKKPEEEIEEEEESEGKDKGKGKGKKSKKKKKEKEKNPEEEEKQEPEKKISKKKVISVFLFCATMAACIIVIVTIFPNNMEKRDARVAYDYQKYDEVYNLLYGKKLNEEDELLFKKSSIILQMERRLDSYENYEKLDMPLEALDALISGVDLYQNILPRADQYHVVNEVSDIYDQILEKLSDYGLSELDALDIIASGDNVTYSQRLEDIVYGNGVSMESVAEPIQDVLPEEEEIIDRLEKNEESDTTQGEEIYDDVASYVDENIDVTEPEDGSNDMTDEAQGEQE